jgi:hypothetical protein
VITDKQKYAALLYYFVRQSREENPKFSFTDKFGASISAVLHGDTDPSPRQQAIIDKLYPPLKGTLRRINSRSVEFTKLGEEAFGRLAQNGAVVVRGRGKGQGSVAPDVVLKVGTSDKAVMAATSKSFDGFGMGVQLGALVGRSPDAKVWLVMLTAAEKNKVTLKTLIDNLGKALEVTDAVR